MMKGNSMYFSNTSLFLKNNIILFVFGQLPFLNITVELSRAFNTPLHQESNKENS